MDRRSFVSGSAAALLATQLSAQETRPLRFAAIGLGTISDIFMKGCAQTDKAKVTALVTGHPDKAERYAAQYGIAKSSIYSYEDFDRIRDNKDVDAVYVGLPNSMHCEYTVRAAAAGKHVLCEKPMAISSAECRTMIAACRKANVKLMIAYRVQYDPTWRQVIAMVKAGDLGQLQAFQGGFYGQQKPNWRLDPKLAGGGSLLDLGIYPLNAIRYVLGEEPASFTAITATREPGPRFAGMEQSIEWTMKFPSGVLASCGSSYGQSGPGFLNINGDKGHLQVQPAYSYDGLKVKGETTRGPIDIVATGKQPFQFTLEAEYFAGCVHNNTEPLSNGEEGLKDMVAIEGIYRAAGAPIA